MRVRITLPTVSPTYRPDYVVFAGRVYEVLEWEESERRGWSAWIYEEVADKEKELDFLSESVGRAQGLNVWYESVQVGEEKIWVMNTWAAEYKNNPYFEVQ